MYTRDGEKEGTSLLFREEGERKGWVWTQTGFGGLGGMLRKSLSEDLKFSVNRKGGHLMREEK